MERGLRDGMESVGNFRMGVKSSFAAPESKERWVRRAETLTNWLLAVWRREQAEVEEMVSDGERRADEDGHIRRCELN